MRPESEVADFTRQEMGKEYPVLRRLPFIIFLVVALDFLLLGGLCCWFGWKPMLAENGVTTIFGLVVILYYEWRWSEGVAERLESEPAILDAWALEKLLVLVAGIILLIPGILTDLLGLLMLMPSVRRLIVTRSHGAVAGWRKSLENR
jgi:UPF0716 protein FxsA